MTAVTLLTFALAFGLACASPGPTITALVARVVGQGTAGIHWFCAGLLLGDMVWLGSAAFGLAALAATMQPVFAAVRWAGAAYLLFMAWRLWTASTDSQVAARPVRGNGVRLLAGGIALTLGNPKTMLFYLAILPSVVPLGALTPAGFAEIAAIVTVVYTAVLTTYVLLAGRLRNLFAKPHAVRAVNRGAGLVMAGAAVAVAARQ
jgi:threonine/homoserine/homoserine lactone efflux protein